MSELHILLSEAGVLVGALGLLFQGQMSTDARIWRNADALHKRTEELQRETNRGLTANQFSALVAFAFNVGLGAFAKSSVLRAVNEGRFNDVPGHLTLWVRGGGTVLPGLQKRRKAEGELFAP